MKSIEALLLLLICGCLPMLNAQDRAKPDPARQDALKPVSPPISAEWQTKSFDVRFVDPEQIKALFSGRSFVIEVNRDLKVITVHGSPAFLKEVEDTVKRYDVPLPPPANVQITIYLLTTAALAPAGIALPSELSALSKEFGAQTARLADSQVLRVREGQTGQVMGLETKPESASLSRVWLQSVVVGPGNKGDLVSLYGLRVWLSVPSTPAATGTQLKADPDVAADIDIDPGQAVMVSRVGVEKPVAVVVRATVIR